MPTVLLPQALPEHEEKGLGALEYGIDVEGRHAIERFDQHDIAAAPPDHARRRVISHHIDPLARTGSYRTS